MIRETIEARNARYLEKLSRGAPELGFRCLCCRDAALIPGDLISRYSLIAPHEDHCDYDGFSPDTVDARAEKFLGAFGYLCSRPGCNANEVKGAEDENGKSFARFSWGVEEIAAQTCQWVHEQEVKRMAVGIPKPKIDTAKLNQIGKPMPSEKPLNPAPEKPITELDGFKVGDRARITINRFSAEAQKEILKSKDFPTGKIAYVVGFEKSSIDGSLVAVLQIDDRQLRLGTRWLEIMQEVAA